MKGGSCIPTQLSILFHWQSKFVAPVCPFIPTILYIFLHTIELVLVLNTHEHFEKLGEKQQRVNQTNEESTILTC